MKEQLQQELIVALMPYLHKDQVENAKLKIYMVMGKYEVRKVETSLAVYEGDINEAILKRFLMAKISRGCSPRTIRYYKTSVAKSLLMIGKPYNEVTADNIREYLALRIHRDKVSKTTVNNERRNLSAFYGWLQTEEILLNNPMNKVESIKETKKKKKAFEPMELEKIRHACNTTREKALVEIMISTWCRVSEVAQIKIDEISENKILVHGKGDKDREVYLSPRAQLSVEEYLKDRNDNNPYLFPRARYAGDIQKMCKNIPRKQQAEWYKNPSLVGDGFMDKGTIESIIRKIGKSANVSNTHPHRFRRTGATMALRNGMPLTSVSKMLGHENIGTTQIYLDISDAELEQAHEKFVV